MPTSVEGDEMDLATLASCPSLLQIVSVDLSTTVGSAFFAINVDPRANFTQGYVAVGANSNYCYPTHASQACTPFSFWRGTSRYMFVVAASALHSFRVRAVFVPSNSGFPASWVDSFSRVVDIQGFTVFTVSIPFGWHQPFASGAVGTIYLYLETAIPQISNQTSCPVNVMVYFAMSSDLQVRGPRNWLLIPCTNLGLTVADYTPELNVRQAFSGPFDPIGTGCLSASSTDPCFTEQPTHVSDLTRQPQRWINPVYIQGMSTTQKLALINLYPSSIPKFAFNNTAIINLTRLDNSVPGNPAAIFSSNYATPSAYSGGTTNSSNLTLPTWLDHFANCYKFVRGGMRLKMITPPSVQNVSTATSNMMTNFLFAQRAPMRFRDTIVASSGTAPAWSTNYPMMLYDTFGNNNTMYFMATDPLRDTLALRTDGDVDSLEVEVPYNSPSMFMTCGDGRINQASVGGFPVVTWDESNSLQVILGNRTSNLVPLKDSVNEIYRATADDFRFSFIKGSSACVLIVQGCLARNCDGGLCSDTHINS
jgi:hypothetical protein